MVKGLKYNFLNISQFTNTGFKVDFDEDNCLISHRKTDELALTEVRKGSMFVASINSANKDKIFCFYSKASNQECIMCHKNISHLNFKASNTLVKKELVKSMHLNSFMKECVRPVKKENSKDLVTN